MRRVFLHGLGQTSEGWREAIVKLQTAKHCICPDLANILQGKEATYQNLYEAVSAICDQTEEQIDLCGLSLGGVLALNYAIERPEKVHSLALIAPQYKMPKTMLRVQNFLFRFMPKSAFQQMGFEKEAFIRLCKTMMNLDFSDSLSKITCPALVICGEKDRANKKAAGKLAGILANAELREIPGAGHEVNLDAPEKLSEALGRFYHRPG